jgi:uncharacterized protein (TIGR03435 family)
MIFRFLPASAGVALWLGTALGQSFEAASIKLNTSGSNSSNTHTTRGGINAENVTLRQLIERAYVVADDALFGPDWLGDNHFDVAAKIPADAPASQGRLMLQSLLAERFGLKVHRETRSVSGYAIIAGKNPPEMREKPAGVETKTNSGNGGLDGTNASMADLARLLAGRLGQSVQDQTGLKGVFDFNLEWSFDSARPEDRVFTILTAVEQKLGLKLRAQKVSVEVLAVDHAERVPTEN